MQVWFIKALDFLTATQWLQQTSSKKTVMTVPSAGTTWNLRGSCLVVIFSTSMHSPVSYFIVAMLLVHKAHFYSIWYVEQAIH